MTLTFRELEEIYRECQKRLATDNTSVELENENFSIRVRMEHWPSFEVERFEIER